MINLKGLVMLGSFRMGTLMNIKDVLKMEKSPLPVDNILMQMEINSKESSKKIKLNKEPILELMDKFTKERLRMELFLFKAL